MPIKRKYNWNHVTCITGYALVQNTMCFFLLKMLIIKSPIIFLPKIAENSIDHQVLLPVSPRMVISDDCSWIEAIGISLWLGVNWAFFFLNTRDAEWAANNTIQSFQDRKFQLETIPYSWLANKHDEYENPINYKAH